MVEDQKTRSFFSDSQDQLENASGMFSQSTAVIGNLVNTVSKQQNAIDHLSRSNKDLAERIDHLTTIILGDSYSSASAQIKDLTKAPKPLFNRVANLENITSIPGSKNISDCVMGNRQALAQTLQLVSSKVGQHELYVATENSNRILEQSTRQIRDEIANKSIKWNESIKSLSRRIEVFAVDLHSKVDITSVNTLDAHIDKIRNYDTFVTNTKDTMEVLSKDFSTCGASFEIMKQTVNGICNQVTRVEEALDRNEAETKTLTHIGNDVGRFKHELKKSAIQKDTLDRLVDKTNKIEEKSRCIERTVKEMSISHPHLVEHVRSQIMVNTYEKKELDAMMSKHVGKKKFNDILLELRKEVSCKAWAHDVNEMKSSLFNLIADYDKTQKMATVASRFIDWFTKRGDGYGNNSNAIEFHLKNNSRPSNRNNANSGHN
eukprot:CAMPEP_0194367826 /NCGR_PEP_ID=MMETSP0174-20130528/16001_1 /TAXON_ID=216777 /ORGANISM="Proboscia alata, Strain PI-D3" /LENGTH=432 /DNA_ID=CAMNT_0039143863 /DNA_START=145 /DNA_END=1440 /DNA_ORIENTATION=-